MWKSHILENSLPQGIGQNTLFSNQIEGFCDHQYLWKECIDIFDVLHGVIQQGKVASETTNFGGMSRHA